MQQPICDNYRIGLTLATMHPLLWYGLPVPSRAPYLPYTISHVCGDMSSKGYGLPSVVWHFRNLSQSQIQQFWSMFANNSDASVRVYIRTYLDVGSIRQASNFYSIMYRPVDGAGAQILTDSAFHWGNVQFRFAHLEEQ